MSTPDTTTEAFANARPARAEDLPDYAPIPRPAIGPALNEQGYYVGRVERNLYWITHLVYSHHHADHVGASSLFVRWNHHDPAMTSHPARDEPACRAAEQAWLGRWRF